MQGQRHGYPLNPETIVLAFLVFFILHDLEELNKFFTFPVNKNKVASSTLPKSMFYPRESSTFPGSVIRG